MTSSKLPEGEYDTGISTRRIPKGLMHVPGKVHFLCRRLNIPFRKAIVGWKQHESGYGKKIYGGVIIDIDHFSLLKREMDKAGYAFEGKYSPVPVRTPGTLRSWRLDAIPYRTGVAAWKLPFGIVYISGRVHAKCRKLGIPFLKAIVQFIKTEMGYSFRFDGVVIDEAHLHLLPPDIQQRAREFTKEEAERMRVANDLAETQAP